MKFETTIATLAFAIAPLFFAGCASESVKKDLNQKVEANRDVKTRADVRAESQSLIDNSRDLSANQRTELIALKEKASSQIDELNIRSNQLRAALIDVIASPKYDYREVKLAKDRIRELENKKLETSFTAIDEAGKILGHQAPQNRNMVRHFFMDMESPATRE